MPLKKKKRILTSSNHFCISQMDGIYISKWQRYELEMICNMLWSKYMVFLFRWSWRMSTVYDVVHYWSARQPLLMAPAAGLSPTAGSCLRQENHTISFSNYSLFLPYIFIFVFFSFISTTFSFSFISNSCNQVVIVKLERQH